MYSKLDVLGLDDHMRHSTRLGIYFGPEKKEEKSGYFLTLIQIDKKNKEKRHTVYVLTKLANLNWLPPCFLIFEKKIFSNLELIIILYE